MEKEMPAITDMRQVSFPSHVSKHYDILSRAAGIFHSRARHY